MEFKAVSLYVTVMVMVVTVSALPWNKKALRIAGEINKEGRWIGLVNVYPPEEAAFMSSKVLKPHPKYPLLDFSGTVLAHQLPNLSIVKNILAFLI